MTTRPNHRPDHWRNSTTKPIWGSFNVRPVDLAPEVQQDDTLRHSVSPPVDQDLLDVDLSLRLAGRGIL